MCRLRGEDPLNREAAKHAKDTTERNIEEVAAARDRNAIRVARLRPLDAAQRLASLELRDRRLDFLLSWNEKPTNSTIKRLVAS